MGQLLIQVAELQSLIKQNAVVIFDVRHDLMDHDWGRQQYNQAHIPGAHFLDNEAELVGTCTGKNGRHPLPDLTAFRAYLDAYGLNAESRIVVYDASQAHMAARTWWLLRWAGYKHVMILDGGWQAWLEAQGQTQATVPEVGPATDSRSTQNEPEAAMPVVAAAQIQQQLTAPIYTLIDARAAGRYAGEHEPIDPIAGHIPTAVNRPTTENVDQAGYFKSAAQLRTEFNALLNTTHPQQVVHYCGSGITACHNLFAMELAGLQGSRLYAGSWSEWIAESTRPREPHI